MSGDDVLAGRKIRTRAGGQVAVEVYPGDTGMGGISFALPPGNGVIELEVDVGTESHVFTLQYGNAP